MIELDSHIEFLQRIRSIAFTTLKEAEAISRRPWNVETASKFTLAQGLSDVLNAVDAQLEKLGG